MPFIFDWYLAITQAWVVPVIQVADIGGPLAVTFLLMLGNGMVYDLVHAKWIARKALDRRALICGAAVLAISLVYGFVRIAQVDSRRNAAKKVKVGIVQANIGIVTKGRRRLAQYHHQLHLRASAELQKDGAPLVQIERELLGGILVERIRRSAGNVAEAARSLGISRSALYRRLHTYGVLSRVRPPPTSAGQ